jgi:hypothetical protein
VESLAKHPGRIDKIQEVVSGALRQMRHGKKGYTFARTKTVAKWIDDQFDKPEEQKDTDVAPEPATPKPTLGELIKGGGVSGDMQVVYPFLDKPTMKPQGGFRPIEEGTVMRAPWRVTTDHKVFRRESRRQGSKMSVLVDCSGSMGLDATDVENIVSHTPAAVVAGYSGYRDKGDLKVFARNGKRTSDPKAYQMHGGNIVDYPALQWLAKQPSPRYWICDGVVTGINDQPDTELTKKCFALAKHIGARRFQDNDSFQKFLKTQKRSA